MPNAWYNRLVDMLTSRFGASLRNSNWNQHVRLFQSPRALLPDEPDFRRRGGRSRGIENSGNRIARGRPWVEVRARKGSEDTALKHYCNFRHCPASFNYPGSQPQSLHNAKIQGGNSSARSYWLRSKTSRQS